MANHNCQVSIYHHSSSVTLSMSQLASRILYLIKQPQIITFFVALLTVAISLATHEPWLDEAEAPVRIHAHGWHLWSLMQSFHGDGHFPLYHLLLLPIFNIGQAIGLDAFFLVKLFTFIQYTLVAYLASKWIRFPVSLLFLFSYYTLYEYGTISRCYLLSLLFLLIIYQSIITKSNMNKILVFGAYFLFPLTHSLSLIYASALWIYLLVKRKFLEVIALTASASIAFYYLNLNLGQSNPLARFSYLSNETLPFSEYASHFLGFFSSAWIPFSSQSLWWNKSLVTEVSGIGWLVVAIIGLLAIFSLLNLYAFNRFLLLACFVGSISTILLLTVKYPHGSFRHTGYAVWPFLCLLALVLSFKTEEEWNNSRSQSLNSCSRKVYKRLTTYSGVAILAIHSFFGIAAVYKDFQQTFSASSAKLQALNEFTESQGMPQIFAHPCWSFVPIRVLSNWRYVSSPLWDPNGKSCAGAPDMISNLLNAKYPDRIILSTWQYSIKDKSRYRGEFPIFTQPELNQQFGKSIEEFLNERFSSCALIKEFIDTQDGTEYLYECKR